MMFYKYILASMMFSMEYSHSSPSNSRQLRGATTKHIESEQSVTSEERITLEKVSERHYKLPVARAAPSIADNSRKLDSRTLASETIFERFYKEPTPRVVPVPYSSAYPPGSCQLNGAGVYGDMSGREIPLNFVYDLEIESDGKDILETEIIPELEKAVGLDLAVGFSICGGRRELSRGNVRRHRGLQESAIGVGLLPVDSVDNEKSCQRELVSADNECVVINGIMSIYVDETSNVVDSEIITQATTLIKTKMNEGSYDSGVQEDIVKVRFPDSSPTSGLEGDEVEQPSIGQGAEGQKAYAYVILASCAVLAIIALMFFKRKGKQEHVALKDESVSSDTLGKGISPDLEISVTDTTDVSTMGSPSSKDDSSISSASAAAPADASATKPKIPAPLLGEPEEDDEKSYQDDHLLFT